MKNKMLAIFSLAAFLAVATPGFAHEEHCHVVGSDGKLTDIQASENECKGKKGIWKIHHPHCHVNDGHGNLVDATGVHNKHECDLKKGEWHDHGHDSDHAG